MSDDLPEKPSAIPPKAYENPDFLHSRAARAIRILSEYQEPLSRFERYDIDDTIVFMGSARIKSPADAAASTRRFSSGSARGVTNAAGSGGTSRGTTARPTAETKKAQKSLPSHSGL